MRNTDLMILAVAAGAAWWIISRPTVQQQAAATATPINAETLGWYLEDIYRRLGSNNAGTI